MTIVVTDNASLLAMQHQLSSLARYHTNDILRGISDNAEHAVQISSCSRSMKPQWSPLLSSNSLQRSEMALPRSLQLSQAPTCAHDLLARIIAQS